MSFLWQLLGMSGFITMAARQVRGKPEANFWKGGGLSSLSDSAIKLLARCIVDAPPSWSLGLGHYMHGALCRASDTATALVHFNAVSEGATSAGNAAVAAALAREGGVDKEVVLTRYVAGGIADATTQLVLTFPTGHQPGSTDPVSAFFFDEEERVNFSPRRVILPWEVNVCTLTQDEGVTTFACPTTSTLPVNTVDVIGPGGPFTGGWLRLLNTTVGAEDESLAALPATRFPAIGLVFSTFFNSTTQFDQSFPTQWTAVLGAGGIGETNLLTGAVNFAPWVLPDGELIMPGDNSSGGLPFTHAPEP